MTDVQYLHRKAKRLESPIVQEFLTAHESDALEAWLLKYLSDELLDQYDAMRQQLIDTAVIDGTDPHDPDCQCVHTSGENRTEDISEVTLFVALRYKYPNKREYCLFFYLTDEHVVKEVKAVFDDQVDWVPPTPLN